MTKGLRWLNEREDNQTKKLDKCVEKKALVTIDWTSFYKIFRWILKTWRKL